MTSRRKYIFLLITLIALIIGVFSIVSFNHYWSSNFKRPIAKKSPIVENLLKQGERYLNIANGDSLVKGFYYADEGMTLSQKLKSPNNEALAYLLEAKLLYKQKKFAESKGKADTAAKLFHQVQLPVKEAEAYLQLARDNTKKRSDYCDALLYAQKVIGILSKTGPNSPLLVDAYQIAGWCYWFHGKTAIAMTTLQEALRIARHNNYGKVERIYQTMANTNLVTNDIANFLVNVKKALAVADRYKDTAVTFELYTTYSWYYKKENDIASEIKILEKAKPFTDYQKNNNEAIWMAASLGNAYNTVHQFKKSIPILLEGIKKGNPNDEIFQTLYNNLLEAYIFSGQIAKAKEVYVKLNASMKNKPFKEIFQGYFSITRLFLATHEFEKARRNLDSLLQLRQRHDVGVAIQVEQLAFKLDSSQGKLADAIRDYQRYKILADSISNSYHRRQVAELEVQYQTQKKDVDIANKAKNINFLQQAFISQQHSRNFALASAALLVIILGLVINRYRIKQRANKDLTQKQLEISRKNSSLERLLEEREWLLKEIHHRVKNNLQVVISLLNSQSAYLQDPHMLAVLNESQNRINAISMIHHKLYQNENLTAINMPSYIDEMVNSLELALDAKSIEFYLDVENIDLDVQQAVPIGLILNEAITNAIKYAFKGQEYKEINILLKEMNDTELYLEIIDNGCGFPKNFKPGHTTSLGMSLMHGLARQINANIFITSENGVKVSLKWQRALFSVASSQKDKEALFNYE